MEQELQRIGWNLSFDGLEQCKEACSQKGAGVDVHHIVQVAINRDLREVGKPVLPEFASRNGTGELSGPVIVQVQRLRNVGVPSTKQHSDAVSKRLLRLQLTDGHTHCNAIEIDGPISGLSPSTPPGTKLKIISKVQVVGGFVLLKPEAVKVCGGIVEHMVKKWNLQKISAEGVQRDRVGDTSGPPPFIPFEKTTATKPLPAKTQHSTTEKSTSGQRPIKAGGSSTSIKLERGERKPIEDTVGGTACGGTIEALRKNESSKRSDKLRENKREEKTYSSHNEHYRVQEKGGAASYDKRPQKEMPQKKEKPIDHLQNSISGNQSSSQERSAHHQSDRRGERRRHSNKQEQKTGRTVDLSEWIGMRIAEPAVTQREEEPFREENTHSRYQHDQYHQSDRHQRDQHDQHQSDRHQRDQHDRHQSDRHQRDQHDRHQRDQHDRHQSDRHQRDQHDRHQSDRHQRDQHNRHQRDQHDRHQRDQHDQHQSDRHQRDQHDRHQSDRHQSDRHQRDQHDRHQSDRHQRDQHDRHQSDRHQSDRHQSDQHQRDQHDRHQSDRHQREHDRHQSDRHQRDQHDRHQSDRHQREHDRHQRDQHDRHQSDRHQREHDRHQSDRHHFPTSLEPHVLEQYHWDKMVNSKSTVPFSAKPSAK